MLIVAYICSGIILLIILVILLLKSFRNNKRRKKMQQLAQDKTREEILDNLILNKKAKIENLRAASERPYEVVYTTAKKEKGKKGNRHVIMLQIEEISDLSNRKYLLDPDELITIGSGPDNKISLTDALIDTKQCEIGLYEKDNKTVYLRNTGEKRVVLIRKKEWITIGAERIVLMNGDIIEVGRVQLKIAFV